jgi:hypothetical protein
MSNPRIQADTIYCRKLFVNGQDITVPSNDVIPPPVTVKPALESMTSTIQPLRGMNTIWFFNSSEGIFLLHWNIALKLQCDESEFTPFSFEIGSSKNDAEIDEIFMKTVESHHSTTYYSGTTMFSGTNPFYLLCDFSDVSSEPFIEANFKIVKL